MVRLAVIVAAGVGSRLGERTKDKPKGFLLIGHQPIIERSINQLLAAGIEKIVIGTGHLAHVYEELAMKYPQINCVRNPHFASTGSLSTLYQAKELITEDFLLLDSDLLYERKAIRQLIGHHKPNCLLGSEFTQSNDEVFIETDEHHFLVRMSKQRDKLLSVHAELVGISKISLSAFHAICRFAEAQLTENPKLDYEDALVGICREAKVYVQKLKDFHWCEIDDEQQFHRAVNEIYPRIKSKEMIPISIKRNVLLNPGPATTTDSVKYAQVVPDICPREEEFGQCMQFISTELTKLVADPTDYTTVLFGGSGTAAVEAILSSVIGEDTLLIVNNGAYGKRMCQIAAAYGIPYLEFKSPLDEPIDLQKLEKLLQTAPTKISHLAIVHNETTTGLLNDIQAVGDMCKRHHIQMIVDAMSSYAAIPIDMQKMNISYLAASSNKNIQGMAGVSFVIAHLATLKSTSLIKPRNFYLNLYAQYKYFIETLQMRFTPPVQTLYALRQAIIETVQEGVENRYARYTKSWETLINGIGKLGLAHLVKPEHHSRIITAIVEPDCENYDFDEMHHYFYRRGFTIYPGKLEGQNTFRIANIGDITYRDIEAFLQLLEEYLTSIGYSNQMREA